MALQQELLSSRERLKLFFYNFAGSFIELKWLFAPNKSGCNSLISIHLPINCPHKFIWYRKLACLCVALYDFTNEWASTFSPTVCLLTWFARESHWKIFISLFVYFGHCILNRLKNKLCYFLSRSKLCYRMLTNSLAI